MQKAVDNYNAAFTEGDQNKLLAAIDPKALSLKRSLLSQFDNAMKSQFAGQYVFEGEVVAVRDRGNGYYEGTIATPGGSAGDRQIEKWAFKQIGDDWLLSEPSRSELGKKLTAKTEHFAIEYYAWDEEIIDEIGKVMETAYQTELDKLGKVPEGELHARIVPTYSSGSLTGGNTVAWYQSGTSAANPDMIVMRSPLSMGFIRSFSEKEGFSVDLQHDITHEFTHETVNRMFGGNARLGSGFSWMSEGIAEHVAGASYPDTIRGMIANNGLIPIQDKSGAIEKQDLEHMYLLKKDFVLAYAQAVELVDFIYTEKGGYDGWWKFVDAFAPHQSLEEAVSSQFGMTVDEFEQKYHEFMKNKYNVR
jgi:hypothetical protein